MPTDRNHPGQGRPLAGAAAAVLVLVTGALVAFAWPSASATPAATRSFDQTVDSVRFTAARLTELVPGSGVSEICWLIESDSAGRHRWCATRGPSGDDWRLVDRPRGVRLRVEGASAQLTVLPERAALAPGRYRWRLAAARCSARYGGRGDRRDAGDCRSVHPADAGMAVRIRRAVPVGCSVKGARQVRRGPGDGRQIALTFDDGPAPGTAGFLDMLDRLNVRATFFLVGSRIAGHGATLRRMVRDGHELANHSFSHGDIGSGGIAATRQISATNAAIRRASGGYRPCLMRPPYGSSGPDLVRRIRAQRMTSILWNEDPQDWRRPGAGKIAHAIRRQTRAGSIILEHDGGGNRSQTLAALPRYVRDLKARGYRFVTVSELLGYSTKYELARQ